MTVAQALTIYATEHAPHTADPARIGDTITALVRHIGDMPLSRITGGVCRGYVRDRQASVGTARRELGTLQAALNHCAREGWLTAAPRVTLPPRPQPRDRWLTKPEAYWLLRGARRLPRGRHVAWFILLSLYTGTRRTAACNVAISSVPTATTGRIDPATGVLYRAGEAQRRTRKRQTPARSPRKLLAHARRKYRLGHRWFVQTAQGERIADPKKSFAAAKAEAEKLAHRHGQEIDLSDVTPHTLKHTAVTWAMRAGADPYAAADFFGTSYDTLMRVYGHHSPDWQEETAGIMDRRG